MQIQVKARAAGDGQVSIECSDCGPVCIAIEDAANDAAIEHMKEHGVTVIVHHEE